MITKKETEKYIQADIYRNKGEYSRKLRRKAFWSNNTTISLLYFYRWCHYYSGLEHKNIFQQLAHVYCYLRFQKLQNNCGVELNQHTEIGYGLRLPHNGCIIIHPQVVIGNNCEIMQGVTLGNNILKDRDKVPCIGNDVLICAGAKVIGGITIEDGAVVGANAVVNRDVKKNAIVAGMPAKEVGTANGEHVINIMEV